MNQFVDPKKLLFSLPTLCESTPAVDSSSPKSEVDRSIHEDDWRQIEFVPVMNRAHIEKELKALTAFKQKYRRGPGWTSVYIRHEHPTPLAATRLDFASLPSLPISPLWLGSGPPWGGRVNGGFTLAEASDWFIYGQRGTNGKVIQLALSPGALPLSPAMSKILSRMSSEFKLILVDWFPASAVDTSSSESVVAWSMRYQKA